MNQDDHDHYKELWEQWEEDGDEQPWWRIYWPLTVVLVLLAGTGVYNLL